MAHLTTQELETFIAGRLSKRKQVRVIHHLVTGCKTCIALLGPALPPPEDETESYLAEPPVLGPWGLGVYESPLDRAFANVLKIEKDRRTENKKLTKVLELLGPRPRLLGRLTLAQVRAYHGRPIVEALLQRAAEVRYQDPIAMRELCFLAKDHAETVEPRRDGQSALVFDLRARAWAELANAYRVNEEHDAADDAFTKADWYRERGSGDDLLAARLCDLESSLRREQRRFPEAIQLLDRAYDVYRAAGDSHLAGRALINKAISVTTTGDSQAGVSYFREGLALLDSLRDPQLAALGKQSLLYALADCGRFREASRMLMGSGLRQAFAKDPLNLLRLRWVEGKILAGRGRIGRAERAFAEVREGFEEHGLAYDAALVGLELAAVCLRQGKIDEVRELAQDMLDTFEELYIDRESYWALWFFNEVSRHRAVTVQMAEGVHAFLVRYQADPDAELDVGSFC
jgi:hypothetical protein